MNRCPHCKYVPSDEKGDFFYLDEEVKRRGDFKKKEESRTIASRTVKACPRCRKLFIEVW